MYNRYIPQQDGTHRRSRVEEQAAAEQSPRRQPPPAPQASPQASPPHVHLPPNTTNVGSFLRQLLPSDFDTEDLLIVLLLLLMSGDCAEDQNFALLTLALYLFM